MMDEGRSEAARKMGRARTAKKIEVALQNLEKARANLKNPGRKPWPLSRFACTCGAGESLEGHAATCPRGKAIKRRQKAGRPLA